MKTSDYLINSNIQASIQELREVMVFSGMKINNSTAV
jgi:hypothetical protein